MKNKLLIFSLLGIFILSLAGCSQGYKLQKSGDIIAPDGSKYVLYDHPGYCVFRESGDLLFSTKDEYDCGWNYYTVSGNEDYLTVKTDSYIKSDGYIIFESIPLYHKEDVAVPTAMELGKAKEIYYSDKSLTDWATVLTESTPTVSGDKAKELGMAFVDGRLSGQWEDEKPLGHNPVGQMAVVYEGAESLYFRYNLYYSEKYGIVFIGEDDGIFTAPVEQFVEIGLRVIDE